MSDVKALKDLYITTESDCQRHPWLFMLLNNRWTEHNS